MKRWERFVLSVLFVAGGLAWAYALTGCKKQKVVCPEETWRGVDRAAVECARPTQTSRQMTCVSKEAPYRAWTCVDTDPRDPCAKIYCAPVAAPELLPERPGKAQE